VNDQQLGDVPFYKSNNTIIMNEEADAQTLADEISKMAEKVGKPTLVVLDTLARTMAGDENSSERVGEYIKACDKIKQEWGCSVLVVHHTGHSNKDRARGSSSFYGALDAEFKVAAWGDNKLIIESTKMKDAEPPEAMAFVKLPVSLVTDEGDETGSLALELTEDKPVDKASPENIQSVVLDQVRTVDAFGEAPRSELKEAVSLELECSQRTANRHIKKLIDKGVLALRGGKVVVA
jgi:biotin operon repressor